MVVYIDVLFCLNAIGTLFQLLAAGSLCRRPMRTWRTVLSSVLGGGGAVLVFFLPPAVPLQIAAQLCGACLLCLLCFGRCPPRTWFKLVGVFLLVGAAYAGCAAAVWYLLEPAALVMQNGVIYFELSPFVLIGATAGCYLLLSLISRLCRRQPQQTPRLLELTRGARTVSVRALLDTGNTLVEPISGDGVIVVSAQAVSPLFGAEELSFFLDPIKNAGLAPPGVRLIPAGTVSGAALLAAFRPDRARLCRPPQPPGELTAVFVAICPRALSEDYDALLGSHTAL